MSEEQRVAYWLDLAAYDLATAEALLEKERFLYVGFMCHQVVEKTLKACFVKIKKSSPPHHHNLGYFAREAAPYDSLSEAQRDFLDELQPLNVESRYPTYKEKMAETLSHERCRELIKQTKDLQVWLRKRL